MDLKSLFMVFFLLCFFTRLNGQICEGNLGINIFEQGDFGRGTSNVLIDDPGIAPGYQYQSSPPPNDGYYTITNNTSSWGSFAFSSWINIRDNSPDDQGYMMVVNASYSPGLFYEQQVDDLCENTLYVFSADIVNLMKPGKNGIKPNVTFLLNDQVAYSTGDIEEDGNWNTYGFTFTTGPGQTTVKLSLRNNAPGGGGNDLALDNISFRACGDEAFILPETIANICEDGQAIQLDATIVGDLYDSPYIQWQRSNDEGMSWYDLTGETNLNTMHTDLTGGYYYYRFLLANGPANLFNQRCRVVSNEKIVHVVPKFYTITDTLCEGLTFELGNNQIGNAGTYTDSLRSVFGCDSIVTLHLSFIPDEKISASFNIEHPSCDYKSNGSIILNEILNITSPYKIFIDGIESFTGAVNNRPDGLVHYFLTDRFRCSLDTFVELIDPPPFEINLGQDLEIDLGDRVLLDPYRSEEVKTYRWEPFELLNCGLDCSYTEWYPAESDTVVLTAISFEECYDTDSLFIKVRDVRKAFFPNIFTPNGDGINDYFSVTGHIPNMEMVEDLYVYDRWGNLVYENHQFEPGEANSGWDGRFRDGEAIPGVYIYLARIRFLDKEVKEFKGDVSLIR